MEGTAVGQIENNPVVVVGGCVGAFDPELAGHAQVSEQVPAVVQLDDVYSGKAQQAALMMSANGQLSHNPPPSWLCYTAEGAQAAGSSNLYLGRFGPAAITGYVYDAGSGNYAVGHRRWILYPQTQRMGTGDIPPVGGARSSNALWV
jgi:hypothetical protein